MTLNEKTVGRGGRRYAPYAITEQGVAMLSSVLRSERAIHVNIEITRTFVRLRQMPAGNAELARKLLALEKKYDASFDPDRPLAPSFPRRRESSKTNSPRVRVLLGLQPLIPTGDENLFEATTAYPLRVRGQSFDIGPLRRDFLINWIPAYAGMTSSGANGILGFKAVFEAIHDLMSPPEQKLIACLSI